MLDLLHCYKPISRVIRNLTNGNKQQQHQHPTINTMMKWSSLIGSKHLSDNLGYTTRTRTRTASKDKSIDEASVLSFNSVRWARISTGSDNLKYDNAINWICWLRAHTRCPGLELPASNPFTMKADVASDGKTNNAIDDFGFNFGGHFIPELASMNLKRRCSSISVCCFWAHTHQHPWSVWYGMASESICTLLLSAFAWYGRCVAARAAINMRVRQQRRARARARWARNTWMGDEKKNIYFRIGEFATDKL